MRFRRTPLQPTGFGDGARYVHPTSKHVEVLDSKGCHFAPPESRVAQEPDNLCLAVDGTGQRGHLCMREVTAVCVVSFRQFHPVARIAGDATILDRGAPGLGVTHRKHSRDCSISFLRLLDIRKVSALPGDFSVGSGSPGNGHAHVKLAKSVPPHQHESLCRALGAHLGAVDSKISDNDVLRPPGTFNHKPTVRGGAPAEVTWLIRPTGECIQPDELAPYQPTYLLVAQLKAGVGTARGPGGLCVGCRSVSPWPRRVGWLWKP